MKPSTSGEMEMPMQEPLDPRNVARNLISSVLICAGLVSVSAGAQTQAIDAMQAERGDQPRVHQIIIPDEDRFAPFAITIDAGDTVQWTNNDTDDHTVVSDDAVNTARPRGVNHVIPGTDSNHGQPGKFSLRFNEPGMFVYYCRFHSHLDSYNQPVAPGPDGGIQDATGNFGTPMMGVITVLEGD